ncbi:hypothetical protein IC607_07280 [Cellulomonas sp. JH27-2]|uniref:hypothetical protein n=1 Tax=Cellulomonas sp. JH27-2 TaxID=2774139 RepID=UPI001781C471|nr:hypothetical protein [Cellulomonas sp. JH27-2]MBD8058766.1 hypothetical protein [Cellulomonas sp. JH27-2]
MNEALTAAPRDASASPPRAAFTDRLDAEFALLASRRPNVARAFTAWLRAPLGTLLALGIIVGGTAGAMRQDGDQVRFRRAAADMWGTGFFDVFHDGWIQVGPLYVLALGGFAHAVRWFGLSLELTSVAAGAIHGALIMWLACITARRAARASSTARITAQWGVGGLLVVGGLLSNAMVADHPEELVVALLCALAATYVTAGRPGIAALLIILATGVKQWGITCGGVLGAERRIRDVLLFGTVAAVGSVALYAPFLVWGDVQTFSFRWPFPEHTWFEALPLFHGASGWSIRVVQGAASGLAGLAVARSRAGTPLLAILTAISVRLALDPLRLTYYWMAWAAVLAVWAWSTPALRLVRSRLAFSAPTALLTLVDLVPHGVVWHVETVLAVAVPAACLLIERRLLPPTDVESHTRTADGTLMHVPTQRDGLTREMTRGSTRKP